MLCSAQAVSTTIGMGVVKRTMRPMKKSNVSASKLATRREPYQKMRAMTKKTMAWESEYKPLDQIAVRFDWRSGCSRDLLYWRKQSSSRVREATVRMDPAASQAR